MNTAEPKTTGIRRYLQPEQRAKPSCPKCGSAAEAQWIPVSRQLPEDDSEVFAAIWWDDRESPETSGYVIHDCAYYEGGTGSGQKIFSDCEGEEFTPEDVQFWIYKRDLAKTIPLPAPPKQLDSQSQIEQEKSE